MPSLTNLIKKKAVELGFTKVGIAKAEELTEESVQLKKWLSQGYYGEMNWMSENFEKLANPLKIMPEAKSVIVTALNYYQGYSQSNNPESGKISRYAWGDDYHKVVEKKLETLLEYIKSISPHSNGKYYVDTGPIMEKAFARRAGIGWTGKHSLIMNRDYGSWLFLGVILLDTELEYDVPHRDYCGTCTKCIDICPTKAIIAPYILDSTLCISYLTIEHKGDIGPELGQKFDNWIYGCDECQDVCPWNKKFSKFTNITEFESKLNNLNLTVDKLTEMSEIDFNKFFKNSPIKRIKLKKFLNNVGIVKKNYKDKGRRNGE